MTAPPRSSRTVDVVAAAQEERFTRKKYDSSYPAAAVGYCLAQAGIALGDVDCVAFYDKPFLKFCAAGSKLISPLRRTGFRSFREAMPLWLKEKLFQKRALIGKAARRRHRNSTGQPTAVFRAPS